MANETKTKVEDPAATRLLFDALKQKVRGQTALVKLTPADAVALTGMPSAQAEPALKSLVKTYRSHLAVTEEGELVYEFDPSLERRDKVPLRERLAAAGQVAWRGFQFLFKIWIVVTLVVYVVAFIAMMISLMFARSSDDRDDRRGGSCRTWRRRDTTAIATGGRCRSPTSRRSASINRCSISCLDPRARPSIRASRTSGCWRICAITRGASRRPS
jgi:hypothetical protein